MKSGKLYSYDPLDIDEIFIDNMFYKKEDIYDLLSDNTNIVIYLKGFSKVHLVKCMSLDGRKYLRSEPSSTLMDDILKLPRVLV